MSEQIEALYKELAELLVDRLRGVTAMNASDILNRDVNPIKPESIAYLKEAWSQALDAEDAERIERMILACIQLTIEGQTATYHEMLRFYMERGFMHVDKDRIPALDVVPWLQTEKDFGRREQMLKENSIFAKGIVNPISLVVLELTVKAIVDLFGYKNYLDYCESKKKESFDDKSAQFVNHLNKTCEIYTDRMTPWVEEKLGRPFENLSRCHALYLLRITRFDSYFPKDSILKKLKRTFAGLGFDLDRNVVINTKTKYTGGICVGVDIPGKVFVFNKPVGGLTDFEALLHETGHAFFLSGFDPKLPVEYRRIYRTPDLDETFAFLFMNLIENPLWAVTIGGLPQNKADELRERYQTKKLCMIRRYMAKFLAEFEMHKSGDIKNFRPYCTRLNEATGFAYEPEGYLLDMEHEFYSLDYVTAWAGANTLTEYLENEYGMDWWQNVGAGNFLREIALNGRKYSAAGIISKYCGGPIKLPFS